MIVFCSLPAATYVFCQVFLASYTRTCNILGDVSNGHQARPLNDIFLFLFANVLYSQHSTWATILKPVNTAFPSLVTYIYGIYGELRSACPQDLAPR